MSDINSFLKVMRILESRNGQDTDHAEMQEGIHKGQAAIGDVGLMPNTIKEMAQRKQNPSELDNIVKNADPKMVEDILKENPHKYDEYSEDNAKRLLDKTKNDLPLAATGWLYGHNQSLDSIKNKLDADPQYKERIENAMESNQSDQEPFTNKFLTKPKDVLFSKIRNGVK